MQTAFANSHQLVDWPLRDVIEKISNQTGVTIRLSKKIEDGGVQPDQRVMISARDVSAETFLSLLLSDLNLTLMVKREVLHVTTAEDAQSPENMMTRIYPVGDFDPIVGMITTTIEPDSWQDVGGPGSITGFENSRSLVIATRRDLHQKIGPLIVSLRWAKGLQGIRPSEPRIEAGSSASNLLPLPRLSAPFPVPDREKSGTVRVRPSNLPLVPNSSGGGVF